MITVIGGIKGGSGKTTLATNLVVMHSMKKQKVLFIDADEQKTAIDWSRQRENLGVSTPWLTICLSGSDIRNQIQTLEKKYDEIIIDTGGRDTTSQRSALTVSDILLVPFQPRSFDIWTINQIASLIEEVLKFNPNIQVLGVINRADSRGKDNEIAMRMINEAPYITCLPITIGQRKSFSNSSAEGLSIFETKLEDQKAILEMNNLYKHLFNTKKTPL